MSLLDSLFGVQKLFVAGVEQVTRKHWDLLSGATVADNPTTGRTEITFAGGGIADGAVTNAKMANMAESTFKGRAVGAGSGAPTDLTATQATAILDAMTGDSGSGGAKGLVPAQAVGDALLFLRGDGDFAPPVWRYREEAGSSYTLVVADHGQIIQVRNSSTNLDHVTVTVPAAFGGLWVELMAPNRADLMLAAVDGDDDPAFVFNDNLSQVLVPAGTVARLIPVSSTTWRVQIQPLLVSEPLGYALSDAATTDLTTGADVVSFRVPYRFYIDEVRAYLHRDHPSTTGAVTVQINLGPSGASPLFDDLLTIDEGATTSVGSAAPYTFVSEGVRLLNDDDVGTFSVVAAGDGARGLVVVIIGRKFPLPAEIG